MRMAGLSEMAADYSTGRPRGRLGDFRKYLSER